MGCTFTLKLLTHRVETDAEFGSAAAIGEMARAAEEFGYGAVSVTDHPLPGVEWLETGGHHTLDPFVTLAAVATATKTIRLQTALVVDVVPYRHSLLVAKMAATLDVLGGGPVVLGVGAGYVPSEFLALGADFASRNAATDRADDAGLGDRAAHNPRGDPRGHVLRPRPVQQPHPPLYVGGNRRIAMARAARYATGWVPMYNPSELAARRRSGPIVSPAELAEKISELHAIASELGRIDRLAVQYSAPKLHFHTLSAEPARLRDAIDALADAGVDGISVDVPGYRRRSWLAAARRVSYAAHRR